VERGRARALDLDLQRVTARAALVAGVDLQFAVLANAHARELRTSAQYRNALHSAGPQDDLASTAKLDRAKCRYRDILDGQRRGGGREGEREERNDGTHGSDPF
jgi:hypothetical protein